MALSALFVVGLGVAVFVGFNVGGSNIGVAFWVSAVVGRYFYSRLASMLAINQIQGSLFALDRRGALPRPRLGANTTPNEAVGTVLVVVVACYTAFSAGTSNAANAIAPMVGAGTLAMETGLLLVGLAVGLGAFTIGRRTIATMGEGDSPRCRCWRRSWSRS